MAVEKDATRAAVAKSPDALFRTLVRVPSCCLRTSVAALYASSYKLSDDATGESAAASFGLSTCDTSPPYGDLMITSHSSFALIERLRNQSEMSEAEGRHRNPSSATLAQGVGATARSTSCTSTSAAAVSTARGTFGAHDLAICLKAMRTTEMQQQVSPHAASIRQGQRPPGTRPGLQTDSPAGPVG